MAKNFESLAERKRQQVAIKNKKWYSKNVEYHKKYRRKHAAQHRLSVRKWIKKNRTTVLFWMSCRRADKLLRTPKWANMAKIKEIYKRCPKNKVVDHIIPLKGKNISGLHVETNLQYLTARQNSKKRNTHNLEEHGRDD